MTIEPARLEACMRRAAAVTHDTVELPPFALYFHPHDPLRYYNYARPAEAIQAGSAARTREAVPELRTVFAARARMPRFEFIEEYAPGLGPELTAAGFVEEARQPLMICTPATWRAVVGMRGLVIETIDANTPLAQVQTYMTVQQRGFEGDDVPEADVQAAEVRRRAFSAGALSFLACLDGIPVCGGGFTPPLDGLAELVGVATLAAYRRRGIASALTSRAVQAAFELGVEAIFLTAEDERAGKVYERIGFRPIATSLAYIDDRC